MLVLFYLLGMAISFATFSYLKGRSDARLHGDPQVVADPPYILGILTSWMWPVQMVLAVLGGLFFLCYGRGRGTGLTVNQELSSLRELGRQVSEATAQNLKVLTSHNIDPGSLDEQTTRALNARAIEFAIAEDIAMRRQEKGLELVKSDATHEPRPPIKREVRHEDMVFDILDQNGYKVPEEYSARRPKGELDL